LMAATPDARATVRANLLTSCKRQTTSRQDIGTSSRGQRQCNANSAEGETPLSAFHRQCSAIFSAIQGHHHGKATAIKRQSSGTFSETQVHQHPAQRFDGEALRLMGDSEHAIKERRAEIEQKGFRIDVRAFLEHGLDKIDFHAAKAGSKGLDRNANHARILPAVS